MPRGKPTTLKRSLVSRRSKAPSKRKPIAKAQQASRKPKPIKDDIERQAVESLKKLIKVVDRVLVQLGEIETKLPEQPDVPNVPEEHESVQAVRGQTPRA
jgi:hypothetical protein